MSYSKILIAVDSSEFSIMAAKKGFELARQLKAKAALLYVIDISLAIGNIDAGITPQEALIFLKKQAEQTIDQLAAMYNGHDLFRFMPEGHPLEDVIKTAQTWEADLLVVGTHGRKGLDHFFSGSVAEHIVRNSTIPVLVVPNPSMKR